MIAGQPRPTSSAMTGTATRNAASTTVRGPKSGLIAGRLRLRLGWLGLGAVRRGLFLRRSAHESCGRPELPRLARAFGRTDDRLGDVCDRLRSQAGRRQQLLGALLRATDDRARLAARPLERLLDLGPR